MGNWRRAFAAAAAATLLVALAGCQTTTKDATTFIKGELDATYLGTYDQAYIDVVKDMTEADAKEKYENNVQWEAEILLEYLSVYLPTDAVYDRAEEVIAEIYSHAKYSVADAEKLKSGDLAVEVTVSPIEIIPLLSSDYASEVWSDVSMRSIPMIPSRSTPCPMRSIRLWMRSTPLPCWTSWRS